MLAVVVDGVRGASPVEGRHLTRRRVGGAWIAVVEWTRKPGDLQPKPVAHAEHAGSGFEMKLPELN